MEKIKLHLKVMFDKSPISYSKMYEFFGPVAIKFGKKYKDNCEYRLTQKFDSNHTPLDSFYLSNRSLEKTTYMEVILEDISKFNFEFVRSEMNHGIYKNNNSVTVVKYYGKPRQLVNSPYMIDINFGDYICFANGLLMIVPKDKFNELFN